ncbi:MAG TPA: DUF2142 domain-containing protein [Gemmataceae bacterium]|nr:DUF2142 domain-containing protein [Gemmataceae bacterium]
MHTYRAIDTSEVDSPRLDAGELVQTTKVRPAASRPTPSTPSPRRRWGPEHLFGGLVIGFGLLFAFGMPPCQVPDEVSHFHRAYQVSEGRLFPIMVGEWGGGDLPVSILKVSSTFAHLPFHGENRATRENFAVLLATPLNPDERDTTTFPGSAFYTFVPYLPQALGIATARAAGFGPLGIFYAGRLANLALAGVLVFLAIRLMPVFKAVLGTVALIPMTVHQLASMSPDASTIAVALLLAALLLRLALGQGGADRGTIVALWGLAGWLALCKFPYAGVGLLYLAVPAGRLGGWRRYLLVGVVLLLVTAGAVGAGVAMKRFTPGRITPDGVGASMEGQLAFIRAHPIRYAKICAATVAEFGQVWLDQMGTLGWLDTPVNPLAMHGFFTILVLVALGDRTPGLEPGWRVKGAALLAAVVCGGMILTSCYVCGCRVKAPLIVGPQGRYFIPLLPLLLLLLSNRVLRVQAHPRVILALAGGGGAGVLLVAVSGLVRRYYYHPRFQSGVAAVALAVAAAVLLMSVALARRRCPTD